MSDLISSYSEKPPKELDKSTVYKILGSIINNAYDKHCYNIGDNNTIVDLRKLIGDELSQSRAVHIVQPWVTSVRLAAIIEKISIKKTREKYHRQIQYVDAIIKDLKKGIDPAEPLIFFLVGNEINHGLMIEYLEAYKFHFSLILDLKFPTGTPLNPDNIRQYGVHSIFHIGEKLNLNKIGKPSSLYRFVQIITDKEFKDIEKQYSKYSREKLELLSTTNSVCSFIYNHLAAIPE